MRTSGSRLDSESCDSVPMDERFGKSWRHGTCTRECERDDGVDGVAQFLSMQDLIQVFL